MTEQVLADVVRQQAEARLRGDEAWFAAWMTPQALLQLRGTPHGARSVRVLHVFAEGDGGSSEVRYTSLRETYVIRQQWLRADGAWRCVAAACPAGQRRITLIGRLAAVLGRAPVIATTGT